MVQDVMVLRYGVRYGDHLSTCHTFLTNTYTPPLQEQWSL